MLMSSNRLRLFAAPALLLALFTLTGCETFGQRENPNETIFQVYHLHRYEAHDLSEDDRQTLRRMIEDAVGRDDWIRTGSEVRVLDNVMTVRTTRAGQSEIEQLLMNLRSARQDH